MPMKSDEFAVLLNLRRKEGMWIQKPDTEKIAIMQAFFADKLGIFLDKLDGVQLCHNPLNSRTEVKVWYAAG